MKLGLIKLAIIVLIAFLYAGCATSPVAESGGASPAQTTQNELFVGVTPDYPPVIFRQNETMTGIEADLALKLGKALNRPVRFVILRWENQIPALLDGSIDIIMSGMSMTKAREVRIVFTEPYLKSGQLAAFRSEDAKKFTTKDSILNGSVAVGAVKDTTGDAFVKRNFPNAARRTFYPKAQDGVYELKRRSIEIFVNDAPSIVWLVSENEADMAALWEPLTEEHFSWAVKKENQELLMDANSILKQWKLDGTLNEVLRKWLPEGYFKRINQ
jgi:ABC-type amino acid transport substrate-binding protein